MKRTLVTLMPILMAAAAVPAGYEHWSAEQFVAHEQALHKSMKDGLASETLGNWGNHLLMKTRREASSGQAELHEKVADLIHEGNLGLDRQLDIGKIRFRSMIRRDAGQNPGTPFLIHESACAVDGVDNDPPNSFLFRLAFR